MCSIPLINLINSWNKSYKWSHCFHSPMTCIYFDSSHCIHCWDEMYLHRLDLYIYLLAFAKSTHEIRISLPLSRLVSYRYLKYTLTLIVYLIAFIYTDQSVCFWHSQKEDIDYTVAIGMAWSKSQCIWVLDLKPSIKGFEGLL